MQEYGILILGLVFLLFTYNFKLYEFNFGNESLNIIESVQTPRFASNSQFTFFFYADYPDRRTYRYNHQTSTIDMEIDFSQLDFNVDENPFINGMCISEDTLFMTIHSNDGDGFKIACFDLEGNYLKALDIGSMGINGGLTKYNDLFFYDTDTSFNVWHREKNVFDVLFIPIGPIYSGIRIVDDYLYFIYPDEQVLARIPIQEVVNQLFSINNYEKEFYIQITKINLTGYIYKNFSNYFLI